MRQKIKIILILIILSFSLSVNSMPFLGGFYHTDNEFNKNTFTTKNFFSFFYDQKFNDYFKLYTRLTFDFDYYADYQGENNKLTNFSLIPSIDLLYLEFKSTKDEINPVDYGKGFVNYNLFLFRVGRIRVNQSSGFIFNLTGDGIDTFFTIKNFKFSFFAATDALDYGSFFNFMEIKGKPVFTRWDHKRYPLLSNYLITGNDYGFIGDTASSNYNYYFNTDSSDYTSFEKTRLNSLRFASILAGRVYTGFSLEFLRIFFQNLSINFLANVDLVPEEFVLTFPSNTDDAKNTFGGRYTSFYFHFNANGRIYGGLYYAFDAVYETGFNATYYTEDLTLKYYNALINSFAFYTRISYFFDNIVKPAVHVSFMFAYGDEDAEIENGVIYNKSGMDNNFRAPSGYRIGYVIDTMYFSNLCIVGVTNSLKPFAALKSPIFTRIFIEDGVLLILRPVIKGSSFLTEENYYLKDNDGYESAAKYFLGVEIDLSIGWQVFSDLSFKIDGGILIPNYYIYTGRDVLWRVGLSGNFSF